MKNVSLTIAPALAATWVLLSFASPMSAQELNLGPIIDPGIAGQAAAQRQIAEQEYKSATGHSWHGSTENTRTKPARGSRSGTNGQVVSGSTRFRPNMAARRRLVATWTAKTRAASPQIAANLKRDLAGREPIATIGTNIARFGLRTDDVADVMAIYLVSSWQATRGQVEDPSLASVRATRAQMQQVLLANRTFASSSNATKQQLADALLLQMVVDDQSVRIAKGNPAQMLRAQSSVRQSVLRTLKIDLSKLKLTNQGLRFS